MADGSDMAVGQTTVNVDALLAVRFAVRGLLRFLSHAETHRVFQRACARAKLPVKYSQGFNPHPRLSLPLPRPVGVEAEDEYMAVRLFDEQGLPMGNAAEMGNRLAAQLPRDLEVLSATLMKASTSIQPESAQYVLSLTPEAVCQKGDHVRANAADFLARRSAVVERVAAEAGESRMGMNRPRRRQVDVRPFVDRIQFENNDIIVAYGVSNAGTIRVEEVLQLLDLTLDDLSGPIQRRHVTWKFEG
jgi:radical SAM-linked protein